VNQTLFICWLYPSHGRPQKLFQWAKSTFYLSFSGYRRCNAKGLHVFFATKDMPRVTTTVTK